MLFALLRNRECDGATGYVRKTIQRQYMQQLVTVCSGMVYIDKFRFILLEGFVIVSDSGIDKADGHLLWLPVSGDNVRGLPL